MASLKELSTRKELLSVGHRLCAGCGASIVVRQVLLAAETPVVTAASTGCLEVATTIFPYSAWRCSFIHCAFENVAATLSGVETAYRALKKKGKISEQMRFIAFGGDGGTYDIGLQALSGVCERGHRMLYVCYDNEAYMNTGIQRSSATPLGADNTTCPAGKVLPGKTEDRKDLTEIIAAHHIPYVAQASPSRWNDLVSKAQTALRVEGSSFMNVLSPCPRGWRHASDQTIKMAQLAVDTCVWPLYEVVEDKWRLTYRPKEKRPVEEWLRAQGRFAHLFKGDNQQLIERMQADVDRRWEELLQKAS